MVPSPSGVMENQCIQIFYGHLLVSVNVPNVTPAVGWGLVGFTSAGLSGEAIVSRHMETKRRPVRRLKKLVLKPILNRVTYGSISSNVEAISERDIPEKAKVL